LASLFLEHSVYLPVLYLLYLLTFVYLRSDSVTILYGASNGTDLQRYFTSVYTAYEIAIATSTAAACWTSQYILYSVADLLRMFANTT